MRFNIPTGWYDAVDRFDEDVTVAAGGKRIVAIPVATAEQIDYLESLKTEVTPKDIFARLKAQLRAPSNKF